MIPIFDVLELDLSLGVIKPEKSKLPYTPELTLVLLTLDGEGWEMR
jgi:hypothetical protein